MHHIASIALLALLPFVPAFALAQEEGDTITTGKTQVKKLPTSPALEEAIETIATSTDRDAVNAAAAKLRAGGLPAIRVLTKHLSDSRQPPSNYLTRAVSGEVDVGDHSFWLIQDMLESHTSKMDAYYSPLEKDNVEKWLDDREGMSLAQLRREACIGAFARIFAMGEKDPDFDVRPAIINYAKRLVELDKAIHSGG